ncbi:MAG: ArsR family transcriptional regulator [Paracoccaceae bacterium]|nr:MAG: arsenate reductase ArsC [Alphaproteobacteria bacterium]GIX12982.1 MAG: ArsR family transcriptional regulator [Paracoccaceae bacterium]
MTEPLSVLFLCTANSARSIIAEAVLNAEGRGRFRAFSAGARPAGRVNPLAIATLAEAGYPVAGLDSKSWDRFAGPGAPRMDAIITVCDQAAGELCPIWPGHPVTAHWGLPDPAAVTGAEAERRAAFAATLAALRRRIGALVSTPGLSADPARLRARLAAIGQAEG